MNLFIFTKTKDTLAFFFVVVTITLTGNFAQPKVADAGGIGNCLGPCATEGTQRLNLVQGSITAGAATQLAMKETLDGLAWSVAKQMVSQMTQSMVEWINSGFQGSPAFITDLDGMLRDSLDSALGEYIKSLGGIGEFICSPFKLDVQAALQIRYQESQSGVPSGANSCKLSGIEDNIENFLNGSMQDWGEWIQISSNPQNTPYGAYLEGEAKLNIALRNEAGKELTIVNWGEGFMSKKICEGADGKPAAEGVNCKITTPGAVIAAQINNQLNTGTESLIEADEINEIIGALINQLTLQAMQGVNGLLGLGGNSKYTDYSYGDGDNTTSFIESAVTQQSLLNTNLLKQQIASSTDTQTAYLVLAQNTITIASIKTGVITDGQIALTNLLTSSTTASLGITISSTYAEAQAKVNAAVSNGTLPLAVLANIQAQMTAVYNSLAIVAAISPNLVQGTDLTTIPFTTLQSGSNIAKTSLTTFIAGITAELPQIQTTLTSLQQMNAVFVNATSTTALSSNAAQRVVTEYITLIQSGVVISAAGLETKRREWTDTIN